MASIATLNVTVKRSWWLRLLDRPLRDTQVMMVSLGLLLPAVAFDFYQRVAMSGLRYQINGGRWRRMDASLSQ